ncbi:ECF RNA polymerase sigma factor SigW [termite gut metagenome]|uniref:ECF RNA polymerase sigma factor SigW n=1 Tax=termite gut metagenome TaxID=433724 RepID=A0A5J4RK42_9ZZZZ
MINDAFTLVKIREGDIKTFEQVFRLYYPSLCLYACGITGRRDAAEEIVQELFYTLWKNRESLQIVRSLKMYLYGAVQKQSMKYFEHNNVRERYRQYVLSTETETSTSDPQKGMEYQELKEVIDRTLNKLPQRRYRIFQMHHTDGMKYREIAEELSLSMKTIEAEMTRTYRILREEIEKYMRE